MGVGNLKLIWVILFFYQSLWARPTDGLSEAAASPSTRESSECPLAQIRYGFLANDQITCSSHYLSFEASSGKSLSPRELKIGSFNIIRTGTNQSRFKRFDMVADIMNQWDLVAVVEIMPTPTEFLTHNRSVDEVAEAFRGQSAKYSAAKRDEYSQILEESYEMPGYLRILKALRELDETWSLVIAPRATGDSESSLEMSGFYYRASHVQNGSTPFCGGQKGCLIPIDDNLMNIVSRIPFAANFKAGSSKFDAVAHHSRFRENAPSCGSKATGKKQKACVHFTPQEKAWLKKFEDMANAEIRDRFVELAIINHVANTSNNDVMVMGDFNLSLKQPNPKKQGSGNLAQWERAVGDSQKIVIPNDKSSISNENGLSEAYDHFIFDPKSSAFKGCDQASARAFNFTMDAANPSGPETLEKLIQFLKVRKSNPGSLLQNYRDSLESSQMLSECHQSDCTLESAYEAGDVRTILSEYDKRVIKTPSNASGKKQPFKVFIELISDHLPIEMNCEI